MKTLADRLEECLRTDADGGSELAWSRLTLCAWLECSDRDLRRAKAELVDRGVPVAASPAGGYYLATMRDEMWAEYHQYTTRIRKLAKRAKVFARLGEQADAMQLVLDLLPEEEAAK